MIRDAKFADIPAIVGLLQDAHKRTHYHKNGTCDVDVAETKRLLMAAIQRHGHKHGGATWVQVAETSGIITGLLVGTLARVNVIGSKLMATDLLFYASPLVEPADPMALAKGFYEWAESCPEVIEVHVGTTAIINNDPEEAGVIWRRLGLEKYGLIYRKDI